MARFGIRKGRRDAADNLSVDEDGDCARCGGDSQQSSMAGYLMCAKCGYEWRDSADVSSTRGPPPAFRRDAEALEEVKNEMRSGGELTKLLGTDRNISGQQKESLTRLQDKWLTGMHGSYNPAEEERVPLMVSFDEEDNLQSTVVAKLTLLSNQFDGGEEIRVEYPGVGTEFYTYEEGDERGWNRGNSAESTARNIASVINKRSNLVFAKNHENTILFEMRTPELDPKSLVLYIEDPGETDIVAEKDGVNLDPRAATMLSDYQAAVELVLADGVITPSEDQLLWGMRRQLGISEDEHVAIIRAMFGDGAVKECTYCGSPANLYPEYAAWYCEACENWV